MKVKFDFNPFEATNTPLPKGADKDEVINECCDFLVDQIKDYCGDQNSPVAGHGKFPRLSKGYANFKKSTGRPAVPNLEFFGDMLDATQASRVGNRIRVEVGKGQAEKADGHNNHSGKSSLPLRRFIPDEGEKFKKPILDGIRRIILDSGD